MRCDWVNDPTAPVPCQVIDLDTGETLSPCAFADEETGEYVAYIQPWTIDKTTGKMMTWRGKARIRIEVLTCQ